VAAAERAAPEHSLAYSLADLRREADAIGFVLDLPYRAQLEIEAIKSAYGLGLGLDDDERSTIRLEAEWYIASHPQALSLRGGDLVADAFSRDLTLELRERQQHV
jgi:hypothetical protein